MDQIDELTARRDALVEQLGAIEEELTRLKVEKYRKMIESNSIFKYTMFKMVTAYVCNPRLTVDGDRCTIAGQLIYLYGENAPQINPEFADEGSRFAFIGWFESGYYVPATPENLIDSIAENRKHFQETRDRVARWLEQIGPTETGKRPKRPKLKDPEAVKREFIWGGINNRVFQTYSGYELVRVNRDSLLSGAAGIKFDRHCIELRDDGELPNITSNLGSHQTSGYIQLEYAGKKPVNFDEVKSRIDAVWKKYEDGYAQATELANSCKKENED